YSLSVVRDLMSADRNSYASNPALRVPILEAPTGTWFGALNISRELWRSSGQRLRMVWPEDLRLPLLANAQELTLQAMATEVTLIMEKVTGAGAGPHSAKLHESLAGMLGWLDTNVSEIRGALPADRELSYLEVTLFCLVTHLAWRGVVPPERLAPLTQLRSFC